MFSALHMAAIFATDQKDVVCLQELRKDGRMGLTELSKALNIPISTLHERLKSYRQTGVIKRYTALLDFHLLGYSIRAYVFIVADKNQKEQLRLHLLNLSSVNTLMKINHGYDFLVEALFQTMQEVDAFRERLVQKYGAKSVEIHYVIEELKQEGFMEGKE